MMNLHGGRLRGPLAEQTYQASGKAMACAVCFAAPQKSGELVVRTGLLL